MTPTVLENLAKTHIDGRMAYKILYFEQLNPEQKLAYVLEILLMEGKKKLLLMEACKHLAEETVAWKKTPEGEAWTKQKAEERAKRSTDAAKT